MHSRIASSKSGVVISTSKQKVGNLGFVSQLNPNLCISSNKREAEPDESEEVISSRIDLHFEDMPYNRQEADSE